MPTLLDQIGIEIPRQCDGYSLRPFLRAEAPGRWRDEVRWELDFRDFCDDRGQFLGQSPEQCGMSVIRGARYKYIHFAALPPLVVRSRDRS